MVRADESAPASIANVAVDVRGGTRRAGYAVVSKKVQAAWRGKEGIALVEQVAILLALQEEGAAWAQRDVLWYTDNSVVLAAMCKGASHAEAIDAGASTLHLLLARLGIRVWWEYVESKANWSDRLSRELADPWLDELGFHVAKCNLGPWPWDPVSDSRWAQVCAATPALGGGGVGKG